MCQNMKRFLWKKVTKVFIIKKVKFFYNKVKKKSKKFFYNNLGICRKYVEIV